MPWDCWKVLQNVARCIIKNINTILPENPILRLKNELVALVFNSYPIGFANLFLRVRLNPLIICAKKIIYVPEK